MAATGVTVLYNSLRRGCLSRGHLTKATSFIKRPMSSTVCDYHNLMKDYKEMSKINEAIADKYMISEFQKLNYLLLEKDKLIQEKDFRLNEKDNSAHRIIKENDSLLWEKDIRTYRLIEEKDLRLKDLKAHILDANNNNQKLQILCQNWNEFHLTSKVVGLKDIDAMTGVEGLKDIDTMTGVEGLKDDSTMTGVDERSKVNDIILLEQEYLKNSDNKSVMYNLQRLWYFLKPNNESIAILIFSVTGAIVFNGAIFILHIYKW